MRQPLLATAVAVIGLTAALTGCSNTTDVAPEPSGTFASNVLTTESLGIEILDIELSDGDIAAIDYEVTNTSKWDVTLEEAWITHMGVSQATPSTGTQTLLPKGYQEDNPIRTDSPTVTPNQTAAGTISYRVVNPDVDLVITAFDDELMQIGESTYSLQ